MQASCFTNLSCQTCYLYKILLISPTLACSISGFLPCDLEWVTYIPLALVPSLWWRSGEHLSGTYYVTDTFFLCYNLTQMTIEPCPPQKSFCATWAGNFGTFDKGIQWGLECSPGKRNKGERAEDRENTTKTPQIIVFCQEFFFLPKCFFQKAYLFSPHFAKWYDYWLK